MHERKNDIIEKLKINMSDIYRNRRAIKSAKESLSGYGISSGVVEQVLNNPDILHDFDVREPILFFNSLLMESGILSPFETLPYTRYELIESKQYHREVQESLSSEDIVLENVIDVGDGVFVTTIKPEHISQLMKRQVLYYNHDIQRQGRFVKRNNEVRKTPTINKRNVKEMKELLLKRQLLSTAIAFNMAIGSSETGSEYVYNQAKNTLTIKSDSRVDILDGFHRCLASKEASAEGIDLGEFSFILRISNYTTLEAQRYQAQLAKATPIPKARQQELASERLADIVIRHLRADSEIGAMISSSNRVSRIGGELVSYNVMADAIEREFPMKMRVETREVSAWLAKFFEYLMGSFPEQFIGQRGSSDSLMGYNRMFSGYVALASKMRSENIEIEKLKSILQKVDFSKTNLDWQRIGFLDEHGRVRAKASEVKIANYFKSLNLKEGVY